MKDHFSLMHLFMSSFTQLAESPASAFQELINRSFDLKNLAIRYHQSKQRFWPQVDKSSSSLPPLLLPLSPLTPIKTVSPPQKKIN